MSGPTLVFRYLEKRRHQPFPVTGRTGKPFAHAHYNERYGGHTFEMPLSQWQKVGAEIAMGAHRPFCNFVLVDVKLPDGMEALPDENAVLKCGLEAAQIAITELQHRLSFFMPVGKPLEEFTFKEAYALAQKLEIPRYSMLCKDGRKGPLIDAIKAHFNGATTPEEEESL